MQIVLNECWGGFSLSQKACAILGLPSPYSNIRRTDPRLIQCVQTLGSEVNGRNAELNIINIPDDVTDWEINEYDGMETLTYIINGKIHHA